MPDTVTLFLRNASDNIINARLDFSRSLSIENVIPVEDVFFLGLGDPTDGEVKAETRGGPHLPDGWSVTPPYNLANNYGGPGWQDVFSMDYINDFVGIEFQGAGSDLNTLMEQLLADLQGNNPGTDPNLNQLLTDIANLRGEDPQCFIDQYTKTIELYNQEGLFSRIDLNRWPDYLGSNHSLRFGKVVGDTIGLDPVFASLFEPTGGIVGPFNQGSTMEGQPAGYHAIFHDAAGFLQREFDRTFGPGWHYVEDIDGADSYYERFGDDNNDGGAHGQISGISFWTDVLNNENSIVGIAAQGISAAGGMVAAATGGALGFLGNAVGGLLRGAGDLVSGTINVVGDVAGLIPVIGNAIEDGFEALADGSEFILDTVGDSLETALNTAGDAVEASINFSSNLVADIVDGTLFVRIGQGAEALLTIFNERVIPDWQDWLRDNVPIVGGIYAGALGVAGDGLELGGKILNGRATILDNALDGPLFGGF